MSLRKNSILGTRTSSVLFFIFLISKSTFLEQRDSRHAYFIINFYNSWLIPVLIHHEQISAYAYSLKESIFNSGDPGSTPGSGRSTGEGIGYPLQYSWATLVAQLIKNPPAVWETWVVLTQGLSGGSSYWWGWRHEKACPRLDTWQISASCFQVASVPCHVASSQGPLSLLLDMATPSKQWSKSSKEEPIMPSMN